MVKDAWTGWGDHLTIKRLESTHCTHTAIESVVAFFAALVAIDEELTNGVAASALRRRPVAVVVDK